MSLVSKSSLVNLWVKLCIGTIPCVLKWESLFKVSHWYYWCVLYRIGNALYISLSIQKQTFHKISVSINFKYNFRKINVDFWLEALHGIAFNMKKKKKKSRLLSPCFFQYFDLICEPRSCCSGLDITVCSPATVVLSYFLKFEVVKSKTKLYSDSFFFFFF